MSDDSEFDGLLRAVLPSTGEVAMRDDIAHLDARKITTTSYGLAPVAMEGALLFEVRQRKDGNTNDVVDIYTSRGSFTFYHDQDCCESVILEEMVGVGCYDGVPIRVAEERVVSGDTEHGGSVTSTFYTIRTDGPDIDMAWRGESNGYYSEAVFIACRPLPADYRPSERAMVRLDQSGENPWGEVDDA